MPFYRFHHFLNLIYFGCKYIKTEQSSSHEVDTSLKSITLLQVNVSFEIEKNLLKLSNFLLKLRNCKRIFSYMYKYRNTQ